MTRVKRPAPRKRTRIRSKQQPVGRLGRFLRAFLVSAVASFGGASYLLNPQWDQDFVLDQIRSLLEWQQPGSVAPVVAATGPLAQTRFSECPQFFPGNNPPAIPAVAALRELCFSEFAILHNGQTKTPVFVAQRLNRRTMIEAQGNQRTDRFYAEARLPRSERADLSDYKGSGYSRGHMAPAADIATGEGMAQSFSLANMVPQDQSHNAGAWSRIEQDTRKYVMRAQGDVFVFTGPVYPAGSAKTIGQGVAVPSHLYKVVYDTATGRAWVHWQANNAATKAGAPISYAEFVQRTGLHLLSPAGMQP